MKKATLEESVVKTLKKKGLTLASAESITGGGLAESITSVAGSSEVFLGGFVTYSDSSKVKFLEIPKRLLSKHTSVREQFKSDYAISTTGVAGPGKAYGQCAGTVWIAIASKKSTVTVALSLAGDRATIRRDTIQSALATFSRILIP